MKRLLYTSSFIVCLSILLSNLLLAQSPLSAKEAYNYAQNKRNEAYKLFEADPLSTDSIKKGIYILENTISYLDHPKVIEFANDNRFLRHRKFDVYYDLALSYALLKNKAKCILYIKKMCDEDASTNYRALSIQEDVTFDFIKNEMEYKEVIKKLNSLGNIFNYTNYLTPYSYNISNNEKIIGLTIFWQVVKNKFVNFDLVHEINWNELFLVYLQKVIETKSTLDYYWTLQNLCALLKDSHTNVYPPKELKDSVYSRPPLVTELIEDKVIITKILSKSLKQLGVEPGQEIISIDNIPVKKYAIEKIMPFQSSSTVQDLNKRVYSYYLLSGKSDQPITLTISDKSGYNKKTINRSGYYDIESQPIFEYKNISNNIAYVALNSFEKDTVIKMFENSFSEILKSDALILDLRNNGGGNSNIGFTILGYLTNKEFPSSRYRLRASNDDLSWQYFPPLNWKPIGKNYYSKPVVVLINNTTFSAAEDFCIAFDYMERGQLVGEPTAGSSGQPYSFSLPGGLTGRVCSKREYYPNGKEFVGIGIQPNILVHNTIEDVKLNSDRILNKALEHLDKILNK